jgi:hypothetical protein
MATFHVAMTASASDRSLEDMFLYGSCSVDFSQAHNAARHALRFSISPPGLSSMMFAVTRELWSNPFNGKVVFGTDGKH